MYVEAKLQFHTIIDQIFPDYRKVFGDLFSKVSLSILREYPSSEKILEMEEEELAERSEELGDYFMGKLREINNPVITEVRGKGLFVGVELKVPARIYCERLKEEGLLCKETHENVIRFAPPLIISMEDLDWAIERIRKVLS